MICRLVVAIPAVCELGCGPLPAEDGERVLAPLRAPLSPEHGPAVEVVVLERLAALRVGPADPLGLGA
ncbi:MAG: hypothetical protein ACPHL3_04025, partial [Paracoccaceae bacterium]